MGILDGNLAIDKLLWLSKKLVFLAETYRMNLSRKCASVRNAWNELDDGIIRKCFVVFTLTIKPRLKMILGLPEPEQINGIKVTCIVRHIETSKRAPE